MNLVLIVLGIIFGLIMIIMGSLHADRSFTDSLKSGVIYTSCSLVDRCGEQSHNHTNQMMFVKCVENSSGCPGQPIIPWYLVIGGILTIIFLVGRIILCRVRSSIILDEVIRILQLFLSRLRLLVYVPINSV